MRTSIFAIVCAVALVCPHSIFAQCSAEVLCKDPPSAYSKNLFFSPHFFAIRGAELFERWFNTRPFPESSAARRYRTETKEQLREEWQEFLGIDVFYPYYKVREIEKHVQEKTKFELFKFKGKAEFETGTSSVKYIFKKKF